MYTYEQIKEDVQEIFRDIFDDDGIVVTEELSAKDIYDWDSLMQIRLVEAIESHFKIEFVYDEITGMKNVGEMLNLIKNKTEQ